MYRSSCAGAAHSPLSSGPRGRGRLRGPKDFLENNYPGEGPNHMQLFGGAPYTIITIVVLIILDLLVAILVVLFQLVIRY